MNQDHKTLNLNFFNKLLGLPEAKHRMLRVDGTDDCSSEESSVEKVVVSPFLLLFRHHLKYKKIEEIFNDYSIGMMLAWDLN